MESWVQSWWPRTNAFCDFSSCVSKVLRLPGKSEARSYKVLHLSRKIIFPNLKISCSKMQPSQEISALTSQHLSWTCLLYCACHAKCIFPVSRACHRFWKCYKTLTFCALLTRRTILCACHGKRHLNVQKCSVPLCFFHFWLGNVLRATTACAFSTCQLPKVVRAWRALCILTSKRASRHNGVHFSTSQQKWSEHGVFCAFWLRNVLCATTTSKSAPTYWLGNVLRATAARTFSTSQILKVLRGWGVLYILTWKCASRHNGVQLFIPHLARWLRTRRFSEPTFPPSRATNHWKNTVFRDFPTFSRTWIFFLLRLSLLWSFFSLLWLFPSLRFICPYCRKFDF